MKDSFDDMIHAGIRDADGRAENKIPEPIRHRRRRMSFHEFWRHVQDAYDETIRAWRIQ